MSSAPASPMERASPSAGRPPARTRSVMINRAAVLGAGTMGVRIAAHLANAGIPVVLLDLAPAASTDAGKRPAAIAEEAMSERPLIESRRVRLVSRR